jgi:uncharacterized protein (DUF2267 family)
VRGLYFENWVPAGKPLRIRRRDEFLALVRERYAPRTDLAADIIVAATFRLLNKHVSAGEVADILLSLPEAIVVLATAGHAEPGRSER